MAVSLEEFVDRLVRSGLFTTAELAAFEDSLGPDSQPKDPQGLARQLIRAGKLTKYQATAVYQGRSKGLVLGEYTVLDEIGAGGMGQVLKARHRRMDRVVALKVLPAKTMRLPEVVKRFEREVRAAARLMHPNIVTALDASEHEGIHYLVMEYVEGKDLAQLAAERGPFAVEQAVECIVQAAKGLEYAHSEGVVHRDIKPSNLLLDRKGCVKILDMGLARLGRAGEAIPADESDSLTSTGQVMGTYDYMAPEQAEDTHHADARADVYSLGCTLYRLLTGRRPFQGDTVIQVLLAHQQAPIPSLSEARPDVPGQLDEVFQRMLAKRPEERYQSMTEVIAALEACVAAKPRQPAAAERSSDSALTSFLEHMAEDAATPRHAPARKAEETIGSPADQETGKAFWKRLVPGGKPSPMLYAGIAGGVMALLLVIGLLFALLGGDEEKKPKQGEPVAAVERRESPMEPPPAAGQPPGAPASREEPPGVPLSPGQPTGVPPAAGQPVPRSEGAADSPGTPAPPEEAEAQAAAEQAEAARTAEIERQREMEEQYTKAMQPAEKLALAWDFAAAAAALEKVTFEDEEVAARLEAWRAGVKRLEALKAGIIEKTNTAKPPLKKSDLRIRGLNGEIVKADEAGITAKLPRDKIESLAWQDLGPQAVEKLVRLAADPEKPDDWLAAGVLALLYYDIPLAEALFGQARSLGADVTPYVDLLAVAAFSKARALLDDGQLAEADEALEHLGTTYADTRWFSVHKTAFEVLREEASKSLLETEAEKLYAEAAELFGQQEWFALRPLVQKLEAEYVGTSPVTDTDREPTFTQMEQAVADLGQFITVRQDGKGDFTSIQEAIDAAPPNSLIEIQDNGPYNEKLSIAREKKGVILRGKPGCWPMVTSSGPQRDFPVLLAVQAPLVELERLIFAHMTAAGQYPSIITCDEASLCLRLCILSGARLYLSGHTLHCRIEKSVIATDLSTPSTAELRVTDSFWLGTIRSNARSPIRMENVFLSSLGAEVGLGPCDLNCCTIANDVKLPNGPNTLIDCIFPSVETPDRNTKIEYCNVFASRGFVDEARPGKGCFSAPPMFVNPQMLDYRLMPTSPCIGKASDGGDLGCRYTPEMIEMCQKALELRAQGVIKF